MMQKIREAGERAKAMPDTPGDGPFAAIKEEVQSLPDHVVYRPGDLSKLDGLKMPIVVWGNGGCSSDGAGQRQQLEEIASYGYLVIANGSIKSGPGAPLQPPEPQMEPPIPGQPMKLPPPQTSASQLTEAIDWAIAQNSRAESPFHGRIDTHAIAVSGWSCGGVQALRIGSSDPRVRAIVIHNSGLFSGSVSMPGMDLPKTALNQLKAPVIYILGGPSDIAYANGMDDYRRIATVPAAVVNIGNIGHGGTFYEPNGGKAAQIDLAWLNWRLKGDPRAAKMFLGDHCELCGDPEVTFQKKHLD